MFILGNNKQKNPPQQQTPVMPHIKQACSELNPTELPLQVRGTRDLDGHKRCTGSLLVAVTASVLVLQPTQMCVELLLIFQI